MARTKIAECLDKAVHHGKAKTGYFSRIIYADNTAEYIISAVKNTMDKCGGVVHTTIPHNPEENGITERVNRTLLDAIRSVLFTAYLDDSYWPYAACDV